MIRASVLVFTVLFASYTWATLSEYHLRLKGHLFFPSTLKVNSAEKFKLIITNEDDTAEEFDSFSLNREKVLFPEQSTTLYIGPLSAGTYPFFGEFHPHLAQGVILAAPTSKQEATRDQQ